MPDSGGQLLLLVIPLPDPHDLVGSKLPRKVNLVRVDYLIDELFRLPHTFLDFPGVGKQFRLFPSLQSPKGCRKIALNFDENALPRWNPVELALG